jgi:hypothetical protein
VVSVSSNVSTNEHDYWWDCQGFLNGVFLISFDLRQTVLSLQCCTYSHSQSP